MLKNYKLIFLFLVLCSCNQNKISDSEQVKGNELTLPNGFREFYEAFHSDSSYQMNHIIFPLKGVRTRKDSMESLSLDIEYIPEKWKLHKPYVNDGSYSRTFTLFGDIVIENLIDNMGLLNIERRWAKIDTSWNLIYYGSTEKAW